ncbi:putative Josephin domain-containing protein [Plasmopara halstedii]
MIDVIDKHIDENLIRFDEVEGILCNIVMSTTFRRFWTQRHWFAIRKIDGVCYNLDSKLDVPMPFDSDTACYEFLQELVNTGECELFSLKREATILLFTGFNQSHHLKLWRHPHLLTRR